MPEAAAPQKMNAPQEAVEWLFTKETICDVLRTPSTNWRSILKMNKITSGPIIAKRGTPSKVIRSSLVEWWNGLENKLQDTSEKERKAAADNDATVGRKSTYLAGKGGAVVAPEINGQVKKRRDRRR